MIFLGFLETVVLVVQILVLVALLISGRLWLRNYKELRARVEALEKIVHPMHLVQSFYGQKDINQEIHGDRNDPA
jgi:hypothetical protein